MCGVFFNYQIVNHEPNYIQLDPRLNNPFEKRKMKLQKILKDTVQRMSLTSQAATTCMEVQLLVSSAQVRFFILSLKLHYVHNICHQNMHAKYSESL
mmetsp:Transcript_15727/g.33255  ORF Transcript_15727/g.33255 Transcript_15727/m.33255 type:complete len:97 (+) Transcript_15727:962-1252(+)